MNLFITGGAGFIGTNFVRMAIARGHSVLNFDALTYAGRRENLSDLESTPSYSFVLGNICDEALVREAMASASFDAVINFAAESHVDRSIHAARVFSETNVLGTATLLEAARDAGISRFVQISTDEVYGSLGSSGIFSRSTPLNPSSPYSATKTAADLLALAFHHTWGFDVRITRCTNNYGAYQHPEKFIPTIITRALRGEQIPVYGDGLQVLRISISYERSSARLRRKQVPQKAKCSGSSHMLPIAPDMTDAMRWIGRVRRTNSVGNPRQSFIMGWK